MRLNATTTQEKAWMLRAAYELSKERAPLNVTVNGKQAAEIAGAVRLAPSLAALGKGVTLANKGDAPVWRTVSVQGTPSAPLPEAANGLTLRKTVWTMDGQPADLASLKQNDRVIVVLQGQMAEQFLPPDGRDRPVARRARNRSRLVRRRCQGLSLAWVADRHRCAGSARRPLCRGLQHRLDLSPAQSQEARAAADLPPRLYRARGDAGRIRDAGGVVEDMYAPGIIARTAMGKVDVTTK